MGSLNINQQQAASLLVSQRPVLEEKSEILKKAQMEYENEADLVRQLEIIAGISAEPEHSVEEVKNEVKQFEDGYPIGGSWVNRVVHVLERNGEMTTGEIVDLIKSRYEPDIDRLPAVRNVSAVISQNYGYKKRFKRKTNNRGENVNSINEDMELEKAGFIGEPEKETTPSQSEIEQEAA